MPNKPISLQVGRSFIDLCVSSQKSNPCGICSKAKDCSSDDYFAQLTNADYRHKFYIPLHIYIVDMDEYERLQKKYAGMGSVKSKISKLVEGDEKVQPIKAMPTENTVGVINDEPLNVD
jgi:hypothetical protein